MVISSLLSSSTSATSLVDQVQILILLLIVTLIVALFSGLLRVPYTLLLVIVGFVGKTNWYVQRLKSHYLPRHNRSKLPVIPDPGWLQPPKVPCGNFQSGYTC
jgi:hypothetical protein